MMINLTGPFPVSRAAIPLLKRNTWGRIVNMASRSGRTLTSVNNSPYATSKAGLFGLSRSLAGELGSFGTTVNCVAPSRVDTPFGHGDAERSASLQQNIEESPLRRLATTQDIANAVAFLCSDQAAFITGAILDVNGGSFMPS
jgi:3-oxoacyl-[acyl-carrier protein] reductase